MFLKLSDGFISGLLISVVFLLIFFWGNFGAIANISQIYSDKLFVGYVEYMLIASCCLLFLAFLSIKFQKNYFLEMISLFIIAIAAVVISTLKEYVYHGILDRSESTEALTKFALPLISYAAVRYSLRISRSKAVKIFMSLFIASALLIGLGQWILNDPIIFTGEKDYGWQAIIWKFGTGINEYSVRAFGFFESPVAYGLFTIICLYLALLIKNRPIKYLFSLIILVCVYATLNRTIWIVCIVSLITLVMTNGPLLPLFKRHTKILCFTLALVPVLTLSLTSTLYGVAKLEDSAFNRNIIIRLRDNPDTIYRGSYNISNILIGSDMSEIRKASTNRADNLDYTPIDNDILFNYVKFGILGFVGYIGIAYILLYRNIIDYISTNNKAFLFIFSYLVGCIFGGVGNVLLISYANVMALGCVCLLAMSRNSIPMTRTASGG